MPKVHKISQLEKFVRLDKVQTRNEQLRAGEKQKQAAISLRDGGQIQTEIGRCGEIEQNTERRRLTKNAEAAHHRRGCAQKERQCRS